MDVKVGKRSVMRAPAHPFQTRISRKFIRVHQHLQNLCHFPLSRSLRHFNTSQERGTFGCSYGNTWLFRGRRLQGSGNLPSLCHAMVTDFYVCSLRTVSGYGTHVVGSAKAPLSPLTRTTCGQGQPPPGCQRAHRWQPRCCSKRWLRNWSFPPAETQCF